MSRKPENPKPLTAEQLEAARLLIDDGQSDEEIAAALGVTRRTLARWKLLPLFRDRMGELSAEYEKGIADLLIASKRRRVAALQERWLLMQQIRQERGADPDMAGVPGGETGLLVHRFKVVGGGDNARAVDEYEFDAALVREERAHEEQAAKELGQWVDKLAPTNPSGDEEFRGDSESRDDFALRFAAILDAARARRLREKK